ALLSFFFQAEDGIRDSSVTGVQTCALPISLDGKIDRARGLLGMQLCEPRDELRHHVLFPHVRAINVVRAKDGHALEVLAPIIKRSEERRVGKECRTQWSKRSAAENVSE